MPAITPLPPGYAVSYADAIPSRVAPPSPANAFVLGTTDRGSVGQVSNVTQLRDSFGPRVDYSPTPDAVATLLAIGAPVVTVSRVTGPDAVSAFKALLGASSAASVTVTAKSPGQWANGATGGLKVQVVDVSGARRLVITETDVTVATSPACATVADLVAWSDDNTVADVSADGTALPSVLAATSLTGGTDDRANITEAEYQTAADLLLRKYGPGLVFAPGVTDEDIKGVLTAHSLSNNRLAYLEDVDGVSESAAITSAQTMRSDFPDSVQRGGVFASSAQLVPVAGEPTRTVSWATIQGGVQSRVFQTAGLRQAAFGPAAGSVSQVLGLTSEWTDADRHALYVEGVNVATDDGTTISTWGYTTLDLDPLRVDLHQAFVRMCLQWEAEKILASYLSKYINADTLASMAGALTGLVNRYVDDQAINAAVVDVDSVNTPTTATARQLHAALKVQFANTADWVDLPIGVYPTNATL